MHKSTYVRIHTLHASLSSLGMTLILAGCTSNMTFPKGSVRTELTSESASLSAQSLQTRTRFGSPDNSSEVAHRFGGI